MAARRLEAAAPAESQALIGCTFFFFTGLELRDRLTSEHQSVGNLPLKSYSSLGRSWVWDQESKNKMTSLPMNRQWWKIRGIQNRSAELHGSILRCLGPTIVQDSWSFRCSCVYFTTQYNVHCDNRQAGHLLGALRLERCTAAIIFPHNKMAQKITE